MYLEQFSKRLKKRANAEQKYSLIKYTLEIKRKPLYYIMLLILPCVLCTLLVLVSFEIPPENGERIGFCSTVMISISVYLLIMADLLPEKSDTLPILGIYYTITMLEIALALIATIIVLRIYHSVSEPPACFKAIYMRCKAKKRENVGSGSKWKVKKFLSRNAVATGVNPVEGDEDPNNTASLPADVEQRQIGINCGENGNELTEDDHRKIWRATAVTCDRIFFWVFLIIFLGSTGSLVKYQPSFKFDDIFS